MQKYPDNLGKAAELSVSSLQVSLLIYLYLNEIGFINTIKELNFFSKSHFSYFLRQVTSLLASFSLLFTWLESLLKTVTQMSEVITDIS